MKTGIEESNNILKHIHLIQKQYQSIEKKLLEFNEKYTTIKFLLWTYLERGFLKTAKCIEEDQLKMELASYFIQDYPLYYQFISKYHRVMKLPEEFKKTSMKEVVLQTKEVRLQQIESLFKENPKIELTAKYISNITGITKRQTINDMKTLFQQKPNEYELLEQKRLVNYHGYKKQYQKVLILRRKTSLE